MKLLLILFLLAMVSLFNISCSSGDNVEDNEGFAKESSDSSDDSDSEDLAESDEDAEDDSGEEEVAAEDEESDEEAEEDDGDEIAEDEGDSLPENVTKAPADAPPTDLPPTASTGGGGGGPPIQKIKTTPYSSNGRLLNTVYLARPSDTVEAISTKLFGNPNKTVDLKADNPSLKNGVKVGTKVYYNSPNRPEDSTSLITYYEDNNIIPQTYLTKEGDNIRSVSKALLGFGEAWKEVWSTNLDIQEKLVVPGGVELRYWPEGAKPPQASAVVAKTDDFAPSGNDFDNSTDLPPLPDDQAAGLDPALPPPPPPGPEENKLAGGTGMDKKKLMMLGGIGAAAAVLILLVVRSRRSKSIDLGQTRI